MLSNRRNQIIVGAVVLVVLISGYLYWRWNPRPGTESFETAYDLVLKDYAGNDVRLSDYKRQVLVVHAWATWCTYCAEEIRNLATLKTKYGDKIQIIAPNRAESVHEARPFSDALNLGDKVVFLLDPNDSFFKSVEGYAMPETLFINDRGEILFHQHGPMNIAEVEQKISSLVQ
jgi:thiol-disulfide isomerase/thioredoxin